MTVGTGIAIAGVWISVGLWGLSKYVTSSGLIVSLSIAMGITCMLLGRC